MFGNELTDQQRQASLTQSIFASLPFVPGMAKEANRLGQQAINSTVQIGKQGADVSRTVMDDLGRSVNTSPNAAFLGEATEDSVNTFASASTSSLSLEVVPYLLALLDDWDDISDTSLIIRDSIDSFINFEEELGEDVEVDEIGEFYLDYTQNHDSEKYYFHQKLAFPGDLVKEMFERVMIIAANGNDTLKMDFIPSLLSIWTGEKAPF